MTAGAPKKDPEFVKVTKGWKYTQWFCRCLKKESRSQGKGMAVLLEEAAIEKYGFKAPKYKAPKN